MNSVRKLIGFALALALVVLALPASADFKALQILNPTTPVSVGTQTIDVSFKNTGDNSSFNSLTIKGAGTGAGVRIDGAASLSGKRGTFAKLAPNEIQLTDLSPTKVGDSLTIRLTVFITATSACAGGSIAWTGTAWTGSPTDPSNRFALTGVAPVTAVTPPSCSITITNQPADALTGQVITNLAYNTPAGTPVAVSVIYNGQLLANANVSLASACTGGPLTLANASVLTDSKGVATFSALAGTTVGTGCTLTASVPAVPALGSSAPSSSFKVVDAKLKFTGVPTSIAPGVGTDFTVKLLDGGNVIPAGGSASLTVVVQPDSTCTLGPTSQTTTNGVVTFTGVIFGGSAGACELLATATFAGVRYTAKSGSFGVYAKGDLDCALSSDPAYPVWTGLLPPYAFDGSPGVNSEDQIKFFKGVRGANYAYSGEFANKNRPCELLKYTLVNNVPGSGSDTTSQPGKTVPENAFALFYDDLAQPNATFRTLQTYRDEWTDASGWLNKRTKLCLNDGCTDKVQLKACLGTTLVPGSMPVFDSMTAPYAALNGTKMPACVVSEIWTTVVPDGSSACTPATRPSPNSACVRVTSELILVGDPVVPREQ
jgi:hypothetical protein